MKRNKTKIIVFEGADETGKSTQLEKVKESLQEKGYSVYTEKYPMYGAYLGDTILNTLKEGTDYLNRPPVNSAPGPITNGTIFSLLQCVNKFVTMNSLFNAYNSKTYDYILLDRYIMSSVIYDEARIESIMNVEAYKNTVDTKTGEEIMNIYSSNVESFNSEIAKTANKVFGNDLVYIVFKTSEAIKLLTEVNHRETDSFDENVSLRHNVAKRFDSIRGEITIYDRPRQMRTYGGVVIGTIDTDSIIDYDTECDKVTLVKKLKAVTDKTVEIILGEKDE